MKKAKLMLSAIGVLAILSTTFAFKRDSFINHFIYTGPINGGTACQTKTNGAAIWSGTPNVRASTVSLASGCPEECYTTVSDL
jgi:hypothetical protein